MCPLSARTRDHGVKSLTTSWVPIRRQMISAAPVLSSRGGGPPSLAPVGRAAVRWVNRTDPTRMDFRILGPLEALDEGRAIALGGTKQRALLALFLLHANETLSTNRLIDELWGEDPPTNAAKSVQMQIYRLRKALDCGTGDGTAGMLVTHERGYELRVDPERLDAHRFERLVKVGRAELAGGRPQRARAALEDALSLWRGQPLVELAYEPFAQREAARLDDLRVTALAQLVDVKLALGAHVE